jgi:hypothetical protein
MRRRYPTTRSDALASSAISSCLTNCSMTGLTCSRSVRPSVRRETVSPNRRSRPKVTVSTLFAAPWRPPRQTIGSSSRSSGFLSPSAVSISGTLTDVSALRLLAPNVSPWRAASGSAYGHRDSVPMRPVSVPQSGRWTPDETRPDVPNGGRLVACKDEAVAPNLPDPATSSNPTRWHLIPSRRG